MKDLQGILESIVQFHDGGLVTAPVAVVRSTEDSHNVSIVAPVITLRPKTFIIYTHKNAFLILSVTLDIISFM